MQKDQSPPVQSVRASSQWNELASLLAKHGIPARHAQAVGMVTVRAAMGATAADLPLECQQPLQELQQNIRQNMQTQLRSLGVSELFVMCCNKGLWTPRQLQLYIRDGALGMTRQQLCCIRINRLRLYIKNNTAFFVVLTLIILIIIFAKIQKHESNVNMNPYL